jgi:(methylthio)acryloyl-CoA hydratase
MNALDLVSSWPTALPECLVASRRGAVAVLRLSRPDKRNSLSDELVLGLQTFFGTLPEDVAAVVIHGEGDNFCAGLDLNELRERNVIEGVLHSRMGQRAHDLVQFARVPVIAVLHGAVIGGGLELAVSCHVRVAEPTAFYALPEGQRGIFVGAGGSVRLPRLIGMDRMTDMMLTGRVYRAEEGQSLGISQYLVAPGEGLTKALALAERIASNAPLTNFAIVQALPRIVEADPATGFLLESLMTGIAQGDPEAKRRLADFLEKRAAKVGL